MRTRSFTAAALLALLGSACEHPTPVANKSVQTRFDVGGPPGFGWSAPVPLGAPINTSGADQAPALSPDGLSLYFASDRPGGFGGTDLWVSHRASADDPWEVPVNLGSVVNSSGAESGPEFSSDGHLLFFQSDRPGGFGSNDLYVSYRVNAQDDFGWGAPLNLGPDVNTAAAEAGPWLQENGADAPALYFARGPSVLFSDIYSVQLTQDGQPLGPATLVTELSDPNFTDGRPTMTTDGRTVVFYTNRPGGLGATDLWTATRRDVNSPWSEPVNLGAPLNSAAGDLLPFLSRDGHTLLFTSTRAGGLGGYDIWMSTRTSPDVSAAP